MRPLPAEYPQFPEQSQFLHAQRFKKKNAGTENLYFSRKLPNIFDQDRSFVSLTLRMFDKSMVIREMNVPLLNLHWKLFWKNTKTNVRFANEDFHIFMGTRIWFCEF